MVGNASVPTGTYSAVQMSVQSATATYANGTTKTIIMPNSTVRMIGTFNVQSTANTSSTNWINFDIKSSQSIHSAASGQLVFFPVVEVIAWSNAQLSSGANNTVNVQNAGTVTADQSAGMNINGQMQANFVLPLTTNITVSGTGVISVSGITSTGQVSSHQIVMTDPAQFPKGTQAAVITYSQVQVQTTGNGASGSIWVNAQGSGSVKLTAIQSSGEVVGYANVSANASIKAVKYTITSAYIIVNNTRYAMEVPNNQITANVTSNANAKANSTIVVEITPTATATYNQNSTTYVMSAYSSAIVTTSTTASANANVGVNVQLGVNVNSELTSTAPNIQITSATLVGSGNNTTLTVTVKNNANSTVALNNLVVYGKQNVSGNSGLKLNLSVKGGVLGGGMQGSLSGASLVAFNIESGNMVAFSTSGSSLTQISSSNNAAGGASVNSGTSLTFEYKGELTYDSGMLYSTISSGSQYQIIVTGSNGAYATTNVTAT